MAGRRSKGSWRRPDLRGEQNIPHRHEGEVQNNSADDCSFQDAVCDCCINRSPTGALLRMPFPAVRVSPESLDGGHERQHLTVPSEPADKCHAKAAHSPAIITRENSVGDEGGDGSAGSSTHSPATVEDDSNSAYRQVVAGDVPSTGETARREMIAADRAQKKLLMASGVCLIFMVVEVVAGFAANSLALMTDASHLLSDLCAFLIRVSRKRGGCLLSLFALWISQLKGNSSMSFGYHRAEILGAVVSVLLIWGVTAFLVFEACRRFTSPPEVDGAIMLATSAVGTAANFFMTHILKMHSHGIGQVHDHNHDACASGHHHGTEHGHVHSHEHSVQTKQGAVMGCHSVLIHPVHETEMCADETEAGMFEMTRDAALGGGDVYLQLGVPENEIENMNLRAAYIHALGDLLQNVGVMIAAGIIWFRPDWAIADPVCTLVFSVFVLFTTISIIKEAVNVLMEATPLGVDIERLQRDLLSLKGVIEVHDLHVWSLSVGRPALACHLVMEDEDSSRRVLRAATLLCQHKHRILHTTIQMVRGIGCPCRITPTQCAEWS